MNDTSNIFLSAPAGSDNKLKYQFSCQFKPPPNVAGKKCHLKVYFVGAQADDASTVLTKHTTYAIGIDFPQPHSYGTVNEVTNPNQTTTAVPDPIGWASGVVSPSSTGKLVAPYFTSHNQGIVGFISTDNSGVIDPAIGFPSVLVSIPFHQQIVTVSLLKLNGTDQVLSPTSLQQLTVGFMLTPAV